MYNAPEFIDKIWNGNIGEDDVPVFEMGLDRLTLEIAYTQLNIIAGEENLQYPEHVEGLQLDREVMQELLYRHAELSVEIANATPPMWYIGYDGIGGYSICKATHQPVPTELSGIWLAPGCNFLGIIGPYSSEHNAQVIVAEAVAEVGTEGVVEYLLGFDICTCGHERQSHSDGSGYDGFEDTVCSEDCNCGHFVKA